MTTAAAPQIESEQNRDGTAGVIAPPPLIYLSALGIGVGLDAVVGTGSLPPRVAVPLGAASIVTGVGLMGSFVRALRRARTPIYSYTPSEAIVTDGPYRLTRNPAYLGMALTYTGSRSSPTNPGRWFRCRSRSRSSTAA